MAEETRPAWAQRLAVERQARGWTQQNTVEALRLQSDRPLPDDACCACGRTGRAASTGPGPSIAG